MARFGLDAGQYLTIIPNSGAHTHLPIDEPAPLIGVLGSCVELQDVAGRDDIATMARHTDDPAQKAALEELAGDDEAAQQRYRDEVYAPNRSVLDLLEAVPGLCAAVRRVPRPAAAAAAPLLLHLLLAAGEPGRLQHHRRACCAAPGPLGDRHVHRRLLGLPGSLAGRRHCLRVHAQADHRLPPAGEPARPDDHDRGGHRARALPRVPAGAGRPGGQGVPVARSLLFFGCRNRESDLLYADELRDYQEPRAGPRGERVLPGDGRALPLRPGRHARLRGRGVGGAAPATPWSSSAATPRRSPRECGAALTQIFRDKTATGAADAQAWLAGLRATNRFVEDIWGG